MATGRNRIARGKLIYVYPDRTVEFNPGDSIPPIIELGGVAESLKGGPVFEGTDVPVGYANYYLDKVHNLHAFLSDYPSVSREQAVVAVEERLLERIDSIINSDREYVSGRPRFNGTRMTVYTLFDHLAYGDDIDTFLSQYATSVTHELSAELVRVAKLLVEFYAYRIAFGRLNSPELEVFQVDEFMEAAPGVSTSDLPGGHHQTIDRNQCLFNRNHPHVGTLKGQGAKQRGRVLLVEQNLGQDLLVGESQPCVSDRHGPHLALGQRAMPEN